MEYRLDLHIHSRHSRDGVMKLDEIFDHARRRGLAGVAVTDHDTFDGSAEALERAPDDLIVVPGVEFGTEYGHVLCYGLRRDPASCGLVRRDGCFAFAEVCAFAQQQGLPLFMAHPFRDGRFSEALLPQLCGIEAFNGGNTPRRQDANERALALVREQHLPCSAGSDAHTVEAVGRVARVFDLPAHADADAVLRALTRPGGRIWGSYAPAAPEHAVHARMYLHAHRWKKALRQAAAAAAFGLYYDPFASVRADTRAIARGVMLDMEDGR